MTFYGRPLTIASKSVRNDLVTNADRASETLIVERLQAAMPGAAILGEESGLHAGDAGGRRWIVDPLDGTTNFAHAYPPFCVAIAYEEAGVLEAACIYAPKLDECFAARRGGGATLNGAPLRVSRIDTLPDALVCTGFMPRDAGHNLAAFSLMMEAAQAVRRDGSAALNLAYVGAGRFDCFWEYGLHPWDVAAGALIVREAGGQVSNIDGSGFRVDAGKILASNAVLHEAAVELLAHA